MHKHIESFNCLFGETNSRDCRVGCKEAPYYKSHPLRPTVRMQLEACPRQARAPALSGRGRYCQPYCSQSSALRKQTNGQGRKWRISRALHQQQRKQKLFTNLYNAIAAKRLNLVDQRLKRDGRKHLKAPLLVLANEQVKVSGLGRIKYALNGAQCNKNHLTNIYRRRRD